MIWIGYQELYHLYQQTSTPRQAKCTVKYLPTNVYLVTLKQMGERPTFVPEKINLDAVVKREEGHNRREFGDNPEKTDDEWYEIYESKIDKIPRVGTKIADHEITKEEWAVRHSRAQLEVYERIENIDYRQRADNHFLDILRANFIDLASAQDRLRGIKGEFAIAEVLRTINADPEQPPIQNFYPLITEDTQSRTDWWIYQKFSEDDRINPAINAQVKWVDFDYQRNLPLGELPEHQKTIYKLMNNPVIELDNRFMTRDDRLRANQDFTALQKSRSGKELLKIEHAITTANKYNNVIPILVLVPQIRNFPQSGKIVSFYDSDKFKLPFPQIVSNIHGSIRERLSELHKQRTLTVR